MIPLKYITCALFLFLAFGCVHTYVATNKLGESVLPKIPENTGRIVIYWKGSAAPFIKLLDSPPLFINNQEKRSILQGQYTYYDVEPGKHLIEFSGKSFGLEISAGETIFIKFAHNPSRSIFGPWGNKRYFGALTALQVHHTQGASEIENLKETQ